MRLCSVVDELLYQLLHVVVVVGKLIQFVASDIAEEKKRSEKHHTQTCLSEKCELAEHALILSDNRITLNARSKP